MLFDTILELYQAGKATDIVTIQNALKTKDVPPEVYSLDFLKDLLNSVFTAANIRSYAQIVADKALLRRAIRTLEARGIPFVIVSGRSPAGIEPIFKESGFRCPRICCSCSIGIPLSIAMVAIVLRNL